MATQAPPRAGELLTVEQTARRMKTHRQSVYRLIWDGQLEATDLNAGTGKRPRLRISEAAYDRYVASHALDGGR